MILFCIFLFLAVFIFALLVARESAKNEKRRYKHIHDYDRCDDESYDKHKDITSDERARLKGKAGESMVATAITRYLPNAKIYNDVIINTPTGSSQIDHIAIDKTGIYVIETKNYNGTIYGYEDSEQWTQFLGKTKSRFYNPIKQNAGHIRWLKQFLPKLCWYGLTPIVVFTFANIDKVKYNTVTSLKELKYKLQKNTESLYTNQQIEEIESALKNAINNCHIDEAKHIAYVKSIKNQNKENKQ